VSYPAPPDASTPLIDLWVAIICLLGVLFAIVCAVIRRVEDQQRDGDEPDDLLDDAEHWRDR
jgi:hypothetical protein